jgi:hypothetical protein
VLLSPSFTKFPLRAGKLLLLLRIWVLLLCFPAIDVVFWRVWWWLGADPEVWCCGGDFLLELWWWLDCGGDFLLRCFLEGTVLFLDRCMFFLVVVVVATDLRWGGDGCDRYVLGVVVRC